MKVDQEAYPLSTEPKVCHELCFMHALDLSDRFDFDNDDSCNDEVHLAGGGNANAFVFNGQWDFTLEWNGPEFKFPHQTFLISGLQ